MTPAQVNARTRAAAIQACIRRLEATEKMGPRGRRNARRALSEAVRALKAAVALAYPRPPKSKPTRKRATGPDLVTRLRRQGWVETSMTGARLGDLAAARVRVRKVAIGSSTYFFAPPWTLGIPSDRLAEARVSKLRRDAVYTEARMRDDARTRTGGL